MQARDFRAIYDAEAEQVWQTLHRLGIRGADLQDLTHDVFLTAFRLCDAFDAARPLRPWLCGIAVRVVADFRKKVRHEREVHEEPPDVADDAPAQDVVIAARQDRELLHHALESLDLNRRAVFVLFELNGHPMSEIASALEIPTNTAYSRLRLARADFQKAVRRLRTQRGEP